MTQKASTSLKFKNAWTFPEPVESRIANYIDKKGGHWLHAPCGISKLNTGMFKNPNVTMTTLDKNEDVKPDIICDIFKMSEHIKILDIIKQNGGFDGVVSDPLWYFSEQCTHCKEKITNRTKGLAYYERRYLSYQVRQVLKPGGIWLFNGLWFPKVKGLEEYPGPNPLKASFEVCVQGFQSFRNFSAIIYMQRTSSEIGDSP